MAKGGGGYLGLGWIISLILCLFWIGWILAIVERFKRGNIIGGILCIFGYGFGILWLCDLITLIVSKDLKILA
jgi:hypothetical protein